MMRFITQSTTHVRPSNMSAPCCSRPDAAPTTAVARMVSFKYMQVLASERPVRLLAHGVPQPVSDVTQHACKARRLRAHK